MELNSKITYHITNVIFKDFCYVENWHGKVENKFKSFKEFKTEFERCFNLNYFWEHYPTYMSENWENDLYGDQRDQVLKLIREFYPILKLIASGRYENPVDEILDSIIEPYFIKLSIFEVERIGSK